MKQRHSRDNTIQTFSFRRPDLRMVMRLLTGHCTLRKPNTGWGSLSGIPRVGFVDRKRKLPGMLYMNLDHYARDNINSSVLLNWGRIFHQKDLVSKLLRLVKDSGLFS
jgi:hypothetical protein